MARELRTSWQRLVEVDPRDPELLHLCAKLGHRFKDKSIRSILCILDIKERKSFII